MCFLLSLLGRRSPAALTPWMDTCTNTWDKIKMRVHKKVIDLTSSSDDIKQITWIAMDRSR